MHAISADSIRDTRLRFGKTTDFSAISRLIQRANAAVGSPTIGEDELEAVAERGHLLVLSLDDDELAAAACVSPGRGLVFLVIDPAVATEALEHRMIEVADALCESEQPSACTRRARGRR